MTMPQALRDGPFRKVDWAKHHGESYGKMLHDWAATHPIEIRKQVNRDSGAHRWLAYFRSQPPPEVGLALGDIVHNLRSALDHLVFLLVKANGQAPGRVNAFPIYTDPDKFWNLRQSRRDPLRNVSAKWAEEIARWQPFAMSPDAPGDDSLAVLSMLDNIDKHRNLILTAGCVSNHFDSLRWSITPSIGGGLGHEIQTRPVYEDGAVLLHIWPIPPQPIEANIDPESQFALRIAVDIGESQPMLLPEHLVIPVEEVLEAFASAF